MCAIIVQVHLQSTFNFFNEKCGAATRESAVDSQKEILSVTQGRIELFLFLKNDEAIRRFIPGAGVTNGCEGTDNAPPTINGPHFASRMTSSCFCQYRFHWLWITKIAFYIPVSWVAGKRDLDQHIQDDFGISVLGWRIRNQWSSGQVLNSTFTIVFSSPTLKISLSSSHDVVVIPVLHFPSIRFCKEVVITSI